MLSWLEAMSHPDGYISFFNDASPSSCPSHELLKKYLFRQKIPIVDSKKVITNSRVGGVELLSSGYVRLQAQNAVCILDVGCIGPDYLPGHAHADTLSFELSLFGQRVIVNGGTSCYGDGPIRLRERETRSHSTVELNGVSSSEVWGGFRVARRAYPFDYLMSPVRDSYLEVSCSHDGYRRLPGKPIHKRIWSFSDQSLKIEDVIDGYAFEAISRLIFHPMIQLVRINQSDWNIVNAGKNIATLRVEKGISCCRPSNYSLKFGELVETKCLEVSLIDGNSSIQIIWKNHK